jgi:16S rRNA (cytidine1402-2'-O)-methyltransferase
MSKTQSGTLFLIPTPIGDNPIQELPNYNTSIIHNIHFFIVEELRTARRFLKSIGYPHEFTDEMFLVLNEHTNEINGTQFLHQAIHGNSMGLMSEAGMPCTADPGAAVVGFAHKFGISVVPLVGPSSMLLALSSSGFNGQQFAFHGYFPIDKHEREKLLRELEKRANENFTQLFIEAPYLNNAMFDSLCKSLQPDTQLCIASGILTKDEFIKTLPIKLWIKGGAPNFHKVPTVFLIGRLQG